MSHEERLHRLLPEVYEAAANPDLWPPLLGDLAEHLGGTACALTVHNFGLHEGTIYKASGYDPDCVRSYAERYAPRNPGLGEERRYRPCGTISLGQELVPEAELVGSEFYNEWLRPQGLHHRLCAVVRRDGGSAVYLSVMRPPAKEAFGPEEIARARPLLPHLEQAVRLHRRLTLLQMERDAAQHALDLLPTGILLVDDRSKVVVANRRAEEILEAGDGLTVRGGAVRAVDETDRLRTMVAGAVRTAQGRATTPGGALTVSRRSAKRPLSVLVSPMRGSCDLLGAAGPALAAVLVVDPEQPVNVDEERLCQLYGLTRVEARLAWQIAQGKSVEEAAAALRIAVNSARTYLKRIFDKTGVHRQAELVRLLLIGPAELRRGDCARSVTPARQGEHSAIFF